MCLRTIIVPRVSVVGGFEWIRSLDVLKYMFTLPLPAFVCVYVFSLLWAGCLLGGILTFSLLWYLVVCRGVRRISLAEKEIVRDNTFEMLIGTSSRGERAASRLVFVCDEDIHVLWLTVFVSLS